MTPRVSSAAASHARSAADRAVGERGSRALGRLGLLAGPAEDEGQVDQRRRLAGGVPGRPPGGHGQAVQVDRVRPLTPGIEEPAEQVREQAGVDGPALDRRVTGDPKQVGPAPSPAWPCTRAACSAAAARAG